MDIDDLLARSAPPSAERTPALKEALRLLAADAESQARPPRRTRRTLLVGTTSALVVLGATGATAAGFMPGWVPWTTGEGSSCTMQFAAKPYWTDGDSLETEHSTENAAAVDEANRFLATFDLDSIDEAQAIKDFQREEDAVIASMPQSEQAPLMTGDDLALNAVWLKVSRALDADLAALGLPTIDEAVGVSMTWECE